jgi:nitrogen regulatory protein P-II 1
VKEITAIIKTEKLYDVCASIEKAGFYEYTVVSVEGKGKEKLPSNNSKGERYEPVFLPKSMITIFVNSNRSMDIVDLILKKARTGKAGDGKIVVKNIEQVYRIRTGECGESVI